jgi:integrase
MILDITNDKYVKIMDELNSFVRGGKDLTIWLGNVNSRQKQNLLGVDSEIEAFCMWLKEYSSSASTQRAYFAEVERLYLWCRHVLNRQGSNVISTLTRKELFDYEEFLHKPDENWINTKKVRRYKDGARNPEWKPFSKGLAPKNVDRAIQIIDSFIQYLIAGEIMKANPLALKRQSYYKRSQESDDRHDINVTVLERALDAIEWGAVLMALENMPRETDRELDHYERTRYILMLFYNLGARISELEKHRMGHFVEISNDWYWKVRGKGKSDDVVYVNSTLLAAIVRYREYLGLSPFPSPEEKTPLLISITGRNEIKSRQAFNIIKKLFNQAADIINEKYPHKAAKLRRASPHWIRHTMLTHLAERLKDEPWILKKIARHKKFDTTLLYIHADNEKVKTSLEELRTDFKKDY